MSVEAVVAKWHKYINEHCRAKKSSILRTSENGTVREYRSLSEAAEKNQTTGKMISTAIRRGYRHKGFRWGRG